MTTSSQGTLVHAFLEDHKKFMRLLHDVFTALGSRELPRARELAEKLDEVAGPHIAFEEAVLYPAVGKGLRDPDFVRRLYDEHQTIVRALSLLLREDELNSQGVKDVTTAFEKGLGHAEHCGTLISRLAALDESEQQQALDKLLQLRKSGVKWTKLSTGTDH